MYSYLLPEANQPIRIQLQPSLSITNKLHLPRRGANLIYLNYVNLIENEGTNTEWN